MSLPYYFVYCFCCLLPMQYEYIHWIFGCIQSLWHLFCVCHYARTFFLNNINIGGLSWIHIVLAHAM